MASTHPATSLLQPPARVAARARTARSRWLRRAAYLALAIGAAVGVRAVVFRPVPVDVDVVRIARGRVEAIVVNSRAGTVQSRRRAALSPEIGGRVEALLVRKGDRVVSGQVLVRLASADHQAQLAVQAGAVEAARAAEREACASADLADRELVRARRLLDVGAISFEELDRATGLRETSRSACLGSAARARQAESALDLARVTTAKSVLRAPFGGVIAEVSAEVGEWVTPSPPGMPIPAVIELIDDRAIYVSAPLDEADVSKVRASMIVRVTMDAYPNRAFPARVVRVAPYVVDRQDQNRTFEIEVDLDDAAFARTMLPGTSADVAVIVETRDDVLRVPADALRQDGTVLVVQDGVLTAATVGIGLRNWEFAEVTSGLSAGDAVVVSLDRAEVQSGARARIKNEVRR